MNVPALTGGKQNKRLKHGLIWFKLTSHVHFSVVDRGTPAIPPNVRPCHLRFALPAWRDPLKKATAHLEVRGNERWAVSRPRRVPRGCKVQPCNPNPQELLQHTVEKKLHINIVGRK